MADQDESPLPSEYEDSSSDSSEHGDTTDAENEIVNHWEGLRRGVLAYPVSLQLQCLLFVIGNIFEGNKKDLGFSGLSLLPRSIRYQLLLLLPAVDVCKLEGTPVTHDISMDEIWETLYKERLPFQYKTCLISNGFDFKMPQDFLEERRIEVNWKEAYFNTVFSFLQLAHNLNHQLMSCYKNCECVYAHHKHDLLYGIYKFNSTTELYKCFNSNKTLSIHGVSRCVEKCPQLTPVRYYFKYESPAVPFRDSSGSPIKIHHLIELMTDTCQVSLKHLTISSYHFKEIWKRCPSDLIKEFIKSMESLTVFRCDADHDTKVKELLQIIFVNNQCPIKTIQINNHRISSRYLKSANSSFDNIYPYLTGPTVLCHLKCLEVLFDDIARLKQLSNVFLQQQGLEKVSILLQFRQSKKAIIINDSDFIQFISNMMFRPMLTDLTFSCHCEVSFDLLKTFLSQFLVSPYPINLSLDLSCPQFDPLLETFPINLEQPFKSFELKDCSLSSNLVSLLPSNLILKSLTLIDNNEPTTSAFANLTSIKVSDTFTFADCLNNKNISDVCSLFRIITAWNWHLTMTVYDSEEVAQVFASTLSSIQGTLQSFIFDDCEITVPILEAIFLSLSPSDPPYFQLGFSYDYLKEDTLETIRSVWESNGAIKLKTITIKMFITDVASAINSELSDMALEIIFTEEFS